MNAPLTIEERFWAMVSKDCWLWLGSIKPRNGYGHFRTKDKDYNAHRLAYELAYGPIPAGMEVMHVCDVPACVNPAHLKLGTHAENMADCKRKKRHAHGERNTRSKLTEAKVRAILALKPPHYPKRTPGLAKRIAAEYGVEPGAINAIWSGRSWAHLTRAE